jgi:hypothetical protein
MKSSHATLSRQENLHGYRYMEFFLVEGVPVDGQIKGAVYNTTNQNSPSWGATPVRRP